MTGSRVTGSRVTGSRVTGSRVTGSRAAGSRAAGEPPLRLVTYLGENTVPITAALADAIASVTGLSVEFDPAASWDDRLARIESGQVDLAWMCGLLTVELLDAGRLDAQIVAAPVFAGQAGPVYHSVIVSTAPAPDVATVLPDRLVANEPGSWSGHHALRAHLDAAGLPWFERVVWSGGHQESLEWLLQGRAEVAAIDHTIWEHRRAIDPRLDRLHVVDRTQDWPAPPFTLHRRVSPRTRDALLGALTGATVTGSAMAGLTAIVPAGDADYDPIRRWMAHPPA